MCSLIKAQLLQFQEDKPSHDSSSGKGGSLWEPRALQAHFPAANPQIPKHSSENPQWERGNLPLLCWARSHLPSFTMEEKWNLSAFSILNLV